KILPAALTGLGTDLGQVLIGFVLPLPVVVGTFIASIACHIVANPVLLNAGILHTWTPGTDMLQSDIVTRFDFWLSFGIGTSVVVAVIGIGSVIRAFAKRRQATAAGESAMRFALPKGRGDVPIWSALLVFAVGTIAYIL